MNRVKILASTIVFLLMMCGSVSASNELPITEGSEIMHDNIVYTPSKFNKIYISPIGEGTSKIGFYRNELKMFISDVKVNTSIC